MRCVIAVHPYFLAQRDTDLLAESAYLSCAKICIDDSRLSPELHKDKRVTLNKRQMNEISNSTAFIAETNQVMWSLLTNTVPHGRTMLYMVTPANEASIMAVVQCTKIFNRGRNGLQLTEIRSMRLKNEFASNDPNVIFSFVPFQDVIFSYVPFQDGDLAFLLQLCHDT